MCGRLREQDGDAVLRDPAVARDDREPLELRLGYEHAVERVGVQTGKAARALRVLERDRKRLEPVLRDASGNVAGRGELAGSPLDLDLPDGRGADDDEVRSIRDHRAGVAAQARVAVPP